MILRNASAKLSALILSSVALNIFLLAFFIGHHRGGHAELSPSLAMSEGYLHHAAAISATPGKEPFHMTEWLFSPQELEAEEPYASAQFDKIKSTRKQLADALTQGKPTPEAVKKYFTESDQVMAETREHFHQKIAEKILSMTPEERQQFAAKLVQ